MLKPGKKRDRHIYSDVLKAPSGYEFSFAVGTTYSLNPETLTSIAISLGLGSEMQEPDSITLSAKVKAALDKSVPNMLIFCNSGEIKTVKAKDKKFFSLFEDSIFEVKKERGCFHPKVWVLEYKNSSDEKQYRLVVMSKNIAYDQCLDVVCVLDGKKANKEQKYLGIVNFLNYLKDQTNNDDAKKRLDNLCNTIKNVNFSSDSDGGFTFCPLGIGKNAYAMKDKDDLLKKTHKDLVIMSPFVTADFLNQIKIQDDSKAVLITRRSELVNIWEKITDREKRFEIYVINEKILENEVGFEQDNNPQNAGMNSEKFKDIHAKIYAFDKFLYLGSMNATYSALNNNVEAVLKLKFKDKNIADQFKKEILSDNLFEKVTSWEVNSAEKEDDYDKIIKDAINEISNLDLKAVVEQQDNEKCSITVSYEKELILPEGVKVYIRPFLTNDDKLVDIETGKEFVFRELEPDQISKFIFIRAELNGIKKERVILIETEITEEILNKRKSCLDNSILSDLDSIRDYLLISLGFNGLDLQLSEWNSHGNPGSGNWNTSFYGKDIYERLLLKAFLDPKELLKTINKILNSEALKSDSKLRDLYDLLKCINDAIAIKDGDQNAR